MSVRLGNSALATLRGCNGGPVGCRRRLAGCVFQITLCSGRFGEKLGGHLPKSRFVLAYASTVSASRRGCTTFSQIPASIASNFGRRRLAKPQGFFHALQRLSQPCGRAVPNLLTLGVTEEVNDGIGGRIDMDQNALNDLSFNSLVERLRASPSA